MVFETARVARYRWQASSYRGLHYKPNAGERDRIPAPNAGERDCIPAPNAGERDRIPAPNAGERDCIPAPTCR